MIEVKNLSKYYGKMKAVSQLNFSVSKGEIFGFIGPNGAGKTTTIKIISGLLLPNEGTILINGIDMLSDPVSAKKQIGLIPDRPFLYEKLTAMEFLKFTADFFGMSRDEFQKNAEKVLSTFSLSDRKYELIESFSHGMKQRLIMCSALLHNPPIIIVDEPMVGLDPRGIKTVKDLLKRLAKEGTTIFMSTHTLSLAEDVCDRIGIINKGTLMACGTMDELKKSVQSDNANLESVFLQITDENI